jgi:hypothetical protein
VYTWLVFIDVEVALCADTTGENEPNDANIRLNAKGRKRILIGAP